jgi:hypothetical protein
LQNAGFFGHITIHAIHRGLANKVDSMQFLLYSNLFLATSDLLTISTERATEAERSQLLNQIDSRIFSQSYITNVSLVDSQTTFLDELARISHIEYLQGVRRFQGKGLSSKLPAEIEYTILKNVEVLELECQVRRHVKGSTDEIKRAYQR